MFLRLFIMDTSMQKKYTLCRLDAKATISSDTSICP